MFEDAFIFYALTKTINNWFLLTVVGNTAHLTATTRMDALSVANQLRHLSSDPGNRETIVKDEGCLSGLILFLDHPNTEVVYLALQVIPAFAKTLGLSNSNQSQYLVNC